MDFVNNMFSGLGGALGNIWVAVTAAIVGVIAIAIFLAISWRRVVPTNAVHIVQSAKTAKSFGAGSEWGNVYYAVPHFIPVFGVVVRDLPLSNFELDLPRYAAYDKDRVPFEVDVTAFLRIDDTTLAATRIDTFPQLKDQLTKAVQNCVREVLGSFDIHQIMLQRATLGANFTNSIREELKSWGVVVVKNLALNDVRDPNGTTGPVHNIMAMKTSELEMTSRQTVAENKRKGDEAVILANQQVQLKEQDAIQAVGEREAQQIQAVGVAKEKSKQQVAEEAAITTEKDMAVKAVSTVRTAEITRDASVVKADEDRQTAVITAEAAARTAVIQAEGEKKRQVTMAEGQKEQTILIADGRLVEAQRNAQGIQAEGEAKGIADTAINMAVVAPQITLAEKIAESEPYQNYLVRIRQVEAAQIVGVAQAAALEAADIKVIANSGDASSGLQSIGDIIGSSGGQKVGAFLELLANTPQGAAMLASIQPKPAAVPVPKRTANGAAN